MVCISSLPHFMNQSEFNVLITNVAAITNQVFTIKCGEFASHIASDASKNQISSESDYEKSIGNLNFQELLNGGYESIDTLSQELEDVWNRIDQETLSGLMADMPENLPGISTKFTSEQFKLWVVYALDSSDDDPLYVLHKYITGSIGTDHYDELHDSIREAIAFDELAGLIENEDIICSDHIFLEDLITAATIQSFKVFKWLMKRAQLNDQQVVDLLESNITDMNIFEAMYKIINPSVEQHDKIKSIAIIKNEYAVVRLLDELNGVGNG